MHRLKNRHPGERALVFLGGPSLLQTGANLERLAARGFVIFLESKALTERFLSSGLSPNYYIMFYPEKSKSTSFQGVILQSMISGLDLKPLVREERHSEIDHLLKCREVYFAPGKQNIAHKRLRWRPDVFAPGSPFELLPRLPKMDLLTYRPAFEAAVDQQAFSQPIYYFDADDNYDSFSMDRYYAPKIVDDRLVLSASRFSNSAAIAIYPLLKHLGFAKVYFLGSDMSMLGSMEHAAPFTFRSMDHFRVFFERSRRVFGVHFPSSDRRDALADIKVRWGERASRALFSSQFYDSLRVLLSGRGAFQRPRAEMRDARRLMAGAHDIEFVNIFNPYPYAWPAEGIRNITFDQLFKE